MLRIEHIVVVCVALGLMGCPTFKDYSLDGAQPCNLKEQPAECAGADLRDADLRGSYLIRANLSSARMERATGWLG